MKAIKTLKLLKELKHTMNTVELFRFVVNYDKLEKAIKELENLSGSKPVVDNHKTCETCRYWEQDESIDPNNMFGICETYGIEGRYHFCGHWESKEWK